MKIVDLNGNFYGYFTTNRYSNQTKIPLLKSILDAYINNEWESIEDFRDFFSSEKEKKFFYLEDALKKVDKLLSLHLNKMGINPKEYFSEII